MSGEWQCPGCNTEIDPHAFEDWDDYRAVEDDHTEHCNGYQVVKLLEQCICNEYDTRGKSVCGVECAVHPLNGKCPGVRGKSRAQKTHESVQCFGCFVEEEDLEMVDLLRITPDKVRRRLEDLARHLKTEQEYRRHEWREMRKLLSDKQMKEVFAAAKASSDEEIKRLNEIRKPVNLDQAFEA